MAHRRACMKAERPCFGSGIVGACRDPQMMAAPNAQSRGKVESWPIVQARATETAWISRPSCADDTDASTSLGEVSELHITTLV